MLPLASGSGNITNAPLFIDEAAGNYRLQSTSPCINWGNNAYQIWDTDLDGNPRIVENYVDMGTYEYQGITGLVDSDNDGLKDAWEQQCFGCNIEPNADNDGDGQNNIQEQLTGMDPANAASYFKATNFLNHVSGRIIAWPAVTGRVYNIQWTSSLTNDFVLLGTNIYYPQGSYTDKVHGAESAGFYKIDVRLDE